MPRPPDVGVGVCCLIFDYEGQVLLGQRQGAHARGRWAVPGGWVERTDSDLEVSIRREVREETGLSVTAVRLLTVTTEDHADLDVRTVTIYYLATAWTGEPKVLEPEKCVEWRWFDPKGIKVGLFPGLRLVLENKL